MRPALGGDTAVPFAVPARFLATGVASLAAAFTWLAARPELLTGSYLVPEVLAVVHLLTLGFGATVLVGAMHQLVPVLLVAPLYRPGWGVPTFALLALGAAGIVGGFAAGYVVPLLVAGGVAVLAALALFDLNLYRTAARAPKRDLVGTTMLVAAGHLTAAAVIGFLVALGRALPELGAALGYVTPLHVAVGLFGAFFLAIAAAGHKLLGMFVLTHGVSTVRLRAIVILVHLAVAAVALGTFTRLEAGAVAAAALAAAGVLFGLDVRALLAHRMRKPVDPSLAAYLAAPAFLLAALALGAFGRVPAAVAVLLLGFVPLAVAGMLVKITSFLCWQHRYAPRVGRGPVPMLSDMVHHPASRLTAWSLAIGGGTMALAIVTSAEVLARAGAVASAVGAWTLAGHVAWIVLRRHVPRASAPSAPKAARGGAA